KPWVGFAIAASPCPHCLPGRTTIPPRPSIKAMLCSICSPAAQPIRVCTFSIAPATFPTGNIPRSSTTCCAASFSASLEESAARTCRFLGAHSDMTGYFVQRLAETLPVLLLISLLVFLLIHAAPGDPTLLLLGEETNAAE